MLHASQPSLIAALVALLGCLLILLAALFRARRSRYPVLLYGVAAYMVLLHAVWIGGLFQGPLFTAGFAPLMLLTFPWSFAVTTNMHMAGFDTLPGLLLNYARFVLGFGGLQCLLLTLLLWEMRLRPRRR